MLVVPDAAVLKVAGTPAQTETATGWLPITMGTHAVLIVAVTEVRKLSQPLFIETKYTVVLEMMGVVYALLISPASGVPPVATVYQRYCPFTPPDALSVMAEAPQADPPVTVGAGGGVALIVATTAARVLSHDTILIAA